MLFNIIFLYFIVSTYFGFAAGKIHSKFYTKLLLRFFRIFVAFFVPLTFVPEKLLDQLKYCKNSVGYLRQLLT
jgi:hypothetical protein